MLAIIRRLQFASLSAGRRVIALALAKGEELVAHVRVVAALVQGSVDRAAEFLGASEAVAGGWRRVFVVAVGAGDDDFEAVAPLACVGSFGGGDGGAPKGTFEVRGGGWIWAVLVVVSCEIVVRIGNR